MEKVRRRGEGAGEAQLWESNRENTFIQQLKHPDRGGIPLLGTAVGIPFLAVHPQEGCSGLTP